MYASKMMAMITTTTQMKNTMTPGMAYPATVLALATAASYPQPPDLFRFARRDQGAVRCAAVACLAVAPAHRGHGCIHDALAAETSQRNTRWPGSHMAGARLTQKESSGGQKGTAHEGHH